MTWEQFLENNKSALTDNHGWEFEFVKNVLSRVPTLRPETVDCQHPFRDVNGRNRRIDFAIREGEHVRIAIEVDGYDKTGDGGGMSKAAMDDFLVRQNSLTQKGWTVLRFLNNRVMTSPHACVKDIGSALLLARRNAIDLQGREIPKKASGFGTIFVIAVVAGIAYFLLVPSKSVSTAPTSASSPTLTVSAPIKPESIRIEPITKKMASAVISQPEAISSSKSFETATTTEPSTTIPIKGPDNLLAIEAKNHLGEKHLVCGYVTQAVWAKTEKDKPTYLNFEFAYPNQLISARINSTTAQKMKDQWGSYPQYLLTEETLCVEGLIEDVNGKPLINVTNMKQIHR